MELNTVGKHGVVADAFFHGDDKLLAFKKNFYKVSDLQDWSILGWLHST